MRVEINWAYIMVVHVIVPSINSLNFLIPASEMLLVLLPLVIILLL